jgi:uncharacterized sulfatase
MKKYLKSSIQDKQKIIIACVALIFFFALLSCRQQEKPNILFILTDDQGSWTLSSQSFPNAHTPNLDKLAAEGVVMRNAFSASAVCSASRAALISGRYPSEAGVMGVVSTGSNNGIDTSLVLWPEILQDAGYQTALVGKWHLGHTNEYHFPEQNGYHFFSGFLHGAGVSKDPTVRIEGEDTVFKGEYTSDVLTDLAMDYIRRFGDNPWVLSLHYWAPHANTRFPEGFRPAARGRSWLPMKEEDLAYWKDMDLVLPDPDFPNLDIDMTKRMMREYYASVHSVDRNVGRILELLEELDLDQNTIVIFASDHGYMMGHHGLWHKGNGRWLTVDNKDPDGKYSGSRPNLFDLSMRVPIIVRWPGMVEPGSEIEKTVTYMDIYPTLLEMTGTRQPDDLLLRGKSFVPLLKGLDVAWDNTFYAQMSLTNTKIRCIQTPEWKYVYEFADTTKNELYHLSEDPGECKNLIHSTEPTYIEKSEKLHRMLYQRLKEINDPVMNKVMN